MPMMTLPCLPWNTPSFMVINRYVFPLFSVYLFLLSPLPPSLPLFLSFSQVATKLLNFADQLTYSSSGTLFPLSFILLFLVPFLLFFFCFSFLLTVGLTFSLSHSPPSSFPPSLSLSHSPSLPYPHLPRIRRFVRLVLR